MSELTLRLFFEEKLVGALEVFQEEGEPRFRFTYSEAWFTHLEAFALSIA